MRRRDRFGFAHELRTELIDARDAEQAHGRDHLVLQDLQHPHQTVLAVGREAITRKPADSDDVGAKGDRLEEVGSALHTAIDNDRHTPLHHFRDLSQSVERAHGVVELTATVIRDPDDVDVVLKAELGVFRRLDALDHHGCIHELAVLLHAGAVQTRLEQRVGRPVATAQTRVTGEHRTFAVAVHGEVDGDGEPHVARVADALQQVSHPVIVAADVELEDFRAGGRCRDHLFNRGDRASP